MKIRYILSNHMEADVRLSDAMLFAALRQELGDLIEPVDAMRFTLGRDPLWGSEPYRSISARIKLIGDVYLNDAVQLALGARIVQQCEVQAEMDRIACIGYGATLRNMRDPEALVRHCARGDSFKQHESAIKASAYRHHVLVSPNYKLSHIRRFLIVAGRVAAETPYRHCEETPMDLLDRSAWTRQAERFDSALSSDAPGWAELQSTAAEELLQKLPLTSGAIDVGLRFLPDGVDARVESVISAPPGAFDTFHADVHAYAKMVSRHLLALEPSMALVADDEPSL